VSGKLVVVSTPIGNLGDLSPRAREALAGADLVACEDTRHSGRLLHQLGIEARLVSLHEHNERRRAPSLLAAIEDEGKTLALVSDAGTPLLSDPGFLLVRGAIERGLAVEAIPGPSAVLAAIVVSGLPPYPFTFGGFPPPRRGKRRAFYRRFAILDHTLIVFESPHRVLSSLDDALEELGDRRAVVAREMTKLHEEVLRGSLAELRRRLAERERVKGELVIVIAAGEERTEAAR
jgi:16S rRNA (cytidine1402-2'-O)-methyltransferase